MSALVDGRSVDVEQKDIDRYGGVVGFVKVDCQSLSELSSCCIFIVFLINSIS